MAAKTVISLCPEKLTFSQQVEFNSSNNEQWARSLPLDPTLKYVIVPQMNFAVEYHINGKEVLSKRIWIVGVDESKCVRTVRSLSIAALRARAVAYTKAHVSPPTVKVSYYNGYPVIDNGYLPIRAMDDLSFLDLTFYKVNRARVRRPVIICLKGSYEVYRVKYNENQTISTKGDYVELIKDSMKCYTLSDEQPNDDLVIKCIDALETTCGGHFYKL